MGRVIFDSECSETEDFYGLAVRKLFSDEVKNCVNDLVSFGCAKTFFYVSSLTMAVLFMLLVLSENDY